MKMLTDGVVNLQPFSLEEAETHLLSEDNEQEKWLSGGKSTLSSVQEWIKNNQEHWKNDGPVYNFAIWSTAENLLVGMVEANVAYREIPGLLPGDANISYGIYPQARGNGYSTRAVNLICGFLKKKGIDRAVIRIDPENVWSLKIPIACAFQEIDRLSTPEGNFIIFAKDLK